MATAAPPSASTVRGAPRLPPHIQPQRHLSRSRSNRDLRLGWLESNEVSPQRYSSFTASITASSWPSTLTAFQALANFPSASIMNVLRTIPIDFFPYIFFSRQAPYFSATL